MMVSPTLFCRKSLLIFSILSLAEVVILWG